MCRKNLVCDELLVFFIRYSYDKCGNIIIFIVLSIAVLNGIKLIKLCAKFNSELA